MPKVGASQFYAAHYHEDEAGRISYTDGSRAARLASWGLSLSNSDINTDYLDNIEAETAGGEFSGGTLTVGVGEFTQKADQLVLGTKRSRIVVNGKEVEGMIYNDNLTRPFLGVGFIEKLIVHGERIWRGIVLFKTRFNIPEESVDTQGETISWQHDTIVANILRAGTENGDWRIYDEFPTEAQAAEYIRAILNIDKLELEELKVTSAAGTDVGYTNISVEPEISEGRSYRYKTGPDVKLPDYGQNLSAWTVWDGVNDVEAVTGHKVVIAEVDAGNQALAAGMAVVASREE